ncbi:hypothetical protein [Bradyrhizobium sp. ARR65]|uniref:hypothetical protein n=1 Tax=Bradyrhizobium sp. ARR65 TaxID=1040989 RepID=UPI000B22EF75|nr:hypothetical protein [Bradyrhizobium sp. ARR65]
MLGTMAGVASGEALVGGHRGNVFIEETVVRDDFGSSGGFVCDSSPADDTVL